MNKFIEIEYLQNGNKKQFNAFQILKCLNIMEIFKDFNPLLVGTIPINIDIDNSDLDIICEVYDESRFEAIINHEFSDKKNFTFSIKCVDGIMQIVSSFEYQGFIIELFGQPIPSKHQNGYKHMVIENRILTILGTKAVNGIRLLKTKGYKTEPAFGKYLNLKGDPYKLLLEMYDWNEKKLSSFLEEVK